jgi:hypothetical protein
MSGAHRTKGVENSELLVDAIHAQRIATDIHGRTIDQRKTGRGVYSSGFCCSLRMEILRRVLGTDALKESEQSGTQCHGVLLQLRRGIVPRRDRQVYRICRNNHTLLRRRICGAQRAGAGGYRPVREVVPM